MTEEQLELLGLRVTKCKDWRWMPGMVNAYASMRVANVTKEGEVTVLYYEPGYADHLWDEEDNALHYPFLTDSTTVMCLIQLVQEAYKDIVVSLVFDEPCGDFKISFGHPGAVKHVAMSDNLAVLLVGALENASRAAGKLETK